MSKAIVKTNANTNPKAKAKAKLEQAPEITTLANGIRVATLTRREVESVTLGCWYGVGSRHERLDDNCLFDQGGLAHFLEHMLFKGTKRRTAKQIAEQIEDAGGYINAWTGRERTGFYCRMLDDGVELGLDILADMLTSSQFAETELVKERQVVLQEIGQSEDNPEDIIFDHFQATAYPRQSAGHPILGRAETVASFDRPRLIDFFHSHYRSDKMVIAASGAVDHQQFLNLVTRHFSAYHQDLPVTDAYDSLPSLHYKGGNHQDNRDSEQTHVILGFPSLSTTDPQLWAYSLFSQIFSDGASSRLFQRIREELGLVYSIYGFDSSLGDGGLYGIYGGTGPHELPSFQSALLEEINRFSGGISEAELRRAKAQIRSSLVMRRESTSEMAQAIAYQLQVWGRPLSMSESLEKLEAVTSIDILAVAKRLFTARPTLVAVGPSAALAEADDIHLRLLSIWG